MAGNQTKSVSVVRNGAVVDAIVVPSTAIVAPGGVSMTWDGLADPWEAPTGASFLDQDGAAIGWQLQDGVLVAPPEPPPLPPAVPTSVSRAQAKIQLHRAGILDAVKTAVAADPELEIWFTDALTWERQNPHLIELGEGAMALTSDQIDELFIAAAQIAI